MSLAKTKDYTYMVTNDFKVQYGSSFILHISYSTWSSLVPNEMTTQVIDWVKSILDYLIYILI